MPNPTKPRITFVNDNDEQGNPAGGMVSGTGLTITWQNGPLGRGAERKEPNGAFVEDVLDAAKQRMLYYQRSPFRCNENDDAIMHIQRALDCLHARTAAREARAVEGTHEK